MQEVGSQNRQSNCGSVEGSVGRAEAVRIS